MAPTARLCSATATPCSLSNSRSRSQLSPPPLGGGGRGAWSTRPHRGSHDALLRGRLPRRGRYPRPGRQGSAPRAPSPKRLPNPPRGPFMPQPRPPSSAFRHPPLSYRFPPTIVAAAILPPALRPPNARLGRPGRQGSDELELDAHSFPRTPHVAIHTKVVSSVESGHRSSNLSRRGGGQRSPEAKPGNTAPPRDVGTMPDLSGSSLREYTPGGKAQT